MHLNRPTQTLPKGGLKLNSEIMKYSYINDFSKPPLRGGLEGPA